MKEQMINCQDCSHHHCHIDDGVADCSCDLSTLVTAITLGRPSNCPIPLVQPAIERLTDEEITDLIDVSTDRDYKKPGVTTTTIDVYPLLDAQLAKAHAYYEPEIARLEAEKKELEGKWLHAEDEAGSFHLALTELEAERGAAIKEIGVWSRKAGLLEAENVELKQLQEKTKQLLLAKSQEVYNLTLQLAEAREQGKGE
jgi:hypothetical protein